MPDFKSSHEALNSLTPKEVEALKERFGIPEKTPEPTPIKPPDNDDTGGSGGVTAPVLPPS